MVPLPSFLILTIVFIGLSGCGPSVQTQLDQAAEALKNEQAEEARRLYQSVLEYQPVVPEAVEGMMAVTRVQGATREYAHWCGELIKYRPWHREANIAVGKSLMREGNLKDAVVRFIIAYRNSEFKNEKREALRHLLNVRQQLQTQDGKDATQ